jgi:hypothetical protein
MTDKAISPLRRRLTEDMTIRRLGPGAQHQRIRHVKSLADFVGWSPDKATPEDLRGYQLRLASIRTTVPTLNAGASSLRLPEHRWPPVRSGRARSRSDPTAGR